MQKVSKSLFVGLNSDDSINAMPPGDYRDAYNLITANGGVADNPLRENTTSNLHWENESLPSGTNTQIGWFEDRQNNRLVYFIHNSNDDHGIWYFDPESNTHVLILQSQYLLFRADYKITGVGIINDILCYIDGYSPKCLNISRAIDGLYDDSSADLIEQITLNRVSPMTPPVGVKSNDSAVVSNNISSDGWQFAIRYIYFDNEASLFSPLSKLVLPSVYPTNTDSLNKITVTAEVQDSVSAIIKRIQFAFVKNNDGEYRIFKDIPASDLTSYSAEFYNTESALTVDVNETQVINSVPVESNNIALFKERVFTTLDSYDYQDVGSFSLSLDELLTATTESRIHLPGTSYTYGVVCFDEFGRTNGVLNPITIGFDHTTATSNTTIDPVSNVHKNVTWSLVGSPPSWAVYYSLCRKRNNTIETSCVIPVQVMFYKRDDSGDRAVNEVSDNGQIFHESHQNSWTDNLYLRIPDNVPISIDATYKVRMLQSKGQTRDVEPVILVKGGNKIVSGNFGITNWTGKSLIFLVRLESYVSEPSELFFEVGQVYPIVDGEFSVLTGTIYGDYYRISQSNQSEAFQFNKINTGDLYSSTSADRLTSDQYWQATVYSQSPTTASVSIDSVEVSVEREKPSRGGIFKKIAGAALTAAGTAFAGPAGGAIGSAVGGAIQGGQKAPNTTVISDTKRIFTFDYTKKISDNGRAFVEVPNKIINREPTTIGFSERFIPNSKVNGLNLFISGNDYPVSPIRTPIRKLQASDNVILAIHEKNTTSLYVGESFLSSPGGSGQLTKTTAVIGDDRQLSGGFGTLHPESVVEHDGRVWWFDAYSGDVIRYNNGITPIGSVYKMKKYFKEKGDSLVNGYGNVYGGYDPYLDIVYFTFSGGATLIESRLTGSFESSSFVNGDFISTLDPWLQLDPGTSGPSWFNPGGGDGAAVVFPGTGSSDIIYQPVTVGSGAAVTFTGTILNGSTATDRDLQVVFLNNTTILTDETIPLPPYPGFGYVEMDYTTIIPATTNAIGFRFVADSVSGAPQAIIDVQMTTEASVDIAIDESLYTIGDNIRFVFTYDSGIDGVSSDFEISLNAIVIYNGPIVSGVEKVVDIVYSGGDTITLIKTGDSGGSISVNTLRLSDETETIAFVDRPKYERWISKFDFAPEGYGKINNRFFSFKDGQLWEHNAGEGRNSFYGEQYESSVDGVFNGVSTRDIGDKILRNVSVESNDAWDFVGSNPKGQETNVPADKFIKHESTFYADVQRDINTNPALLKAGQIAIKSGKEMIDKAFTITLTNDSDEPVQLDAVNIGFLPYPGQRIN